MQVVRVLRARLEQDLAVALDRRHRGLLLHRQVGVALVEEHVLEDVVGPGERLLDVAELVSLVAVDVAPLAVVVDARLGVGETFLGRGDGRERPVLDLDQVEGLGRGLLVHRDHRGHRVADVAHALARERMLVLGHRHDAVRDREIGAGEHQVHAAVRLRTRGVDRFHHRVRVRRAQQLRVQHARENEVVGEELLADRLGAAVDAAARLADGVKRSAVKARLPARLLGRVHGRASRMMRAASSTDSQICW